MKTPRIRDRKRRALVLRLMKATCMAEKSVYECLALSRRPRSKLAAKAWDRVIASAKMREQRKAAQVVQPAPAAEVAQ